MEDDVHDRPQHRHERASGRTTRAPRSGPPRAVRMADVVGEARRSAGRSRGPAKSDVSAPAASGKTTRTKTATTACATYAVRWERLLQRSRAKLRCMGARVRRPPRTRRRGAQRRGLGRAAAGDAGGGSGRVTSSKRCFASRERLRCGHLAPQHLEDRLVRGHPRRRQRGRRRHRQRLAGRGSWNARSTGSSSARHRRPRRRSRSRPGARRALERAPASTSRPSHRASASAAGFAAPSGRRPDPLHRQERTHRRARPRRRFAGAARRGSARPASGLPTSQGPSIAVAARPLAKSCVDERAARLLRHVLVPHELAHEVERARPPRRRRKRSVRRRRSLRPPNACRNGAWKNAVVMS